MIMPSKDTLYNGRKGIGFKNLSYFGKEKDLRPSLYDDKVIGLGYTPMFLIHSDEALEIKKFKRARENKIEFAYDYGNLNASYVNEKINFSDAYFQDIINPDFEKIDSTFQQTSSLKPYVLTVILENIIIDLEDEVVIAPGMFKLSVSQSVSPISMSKTSCDYKNVENLDTFSSVRIPKHSGVIWKKKGSTNTSNVDFSSVSHLKLNKDVKMCDLFDENNLFIFDDESVRISPHMTGNRALLTNFVEKLLGTVRFGNNDFAVIAGYGDVVIGSMTIKKVYYV
nr:integrase, catalytic region, zinc finger, CCHC-type, peptidase aspartic, catalytic [Tanacetum cinerariifolium]